MNTLRETGLDFSISRESLKATILASLLTVWVLIGLFTYLNRYTKRRYFTIWTTAWLFYVLWLVLNLLTASGSARLALDWARQCCLASVAVFLLWGGVRFLGLRVRQVALGLFLTFLFLWSYVSVYHVGQRLETQVPLFALIGLASVLTAVCFFQYRRRRHFIGAGLLSFGFASWGLYFSAFPLFQQLPELITAGFFITAVLQLFIAVSMIILVLEEVRNTNQQAFQQIRSFKSESKVLRTRIASTEERYRSLFDQAGEAIIITSAGDLRILELNETAQRLLGINQTEASRQCLPAFCQLVNGAGAPKDSAEWVNLVFQQRRLNLIRRNGGATPSEVDGAPIDFEGQSAYQFFFREMTERSRLEQQLRQAEKLSALGQMISGVAHELNNPLAVIKGYLDLILVHHQLHPQTHSDLNKVTQECDRAIKLVRNFLSFAREQPAHREMVDMNEIIQRVSELRRFELNAAHVTLVLELSASLPSTYADPDQAQQLIINLVNNAIQAMADAPLPRKLRISTSRKNADLLQILIEDSGPGVAAGLESRIFEPFFTTKAVGTGTGLGLSIAHSIMSDHRGRIFYQPSALGGAGFHLEFPILTVAPEARAVAPEIPRARTTRAADILVLDDEKSIAELLCEMLSVLGHHPVLCLNPARALELMETRDFDLILSDFRMPVMNGEEFYRRVREEDPELADRIIFLTGDVVNGETQHFLSSTGNPHLGKPFQLQALETVVLDILAKREASLS